MCSYLLKDYNSGTNYISSVDEAIAKGSYVAAYVRNDLQNGANEDACLALEIDNQHAVLAIADGAGGHPAGHKASSLQIDYLYRALTSETLCSESLREQILNAIEKCNYDLLASGKGAATTVVVLEINGDVVRSYHVGDSSMLVVGQRGRIRYQTLSHSPVALGVEAGFIEPESVLHDANRHVVLNLIGTKEMRIEIGPPLKLAPFDTVLLCSDGLTDNMLIDTITSVIRTRPIQDKVGLLQHLCLSNMHSESGYPDDLSVFLYRLR